MNEYEALFYSDELTHHGVLGMKWGIRRYQNKDGTLTSAGKIRYNKNIKKVDFDADKIDSIINTFSNKEKQYYWDDPNADNIGYQTSQLNKNNPFNFILQYKDIPVAFIMGQGETEIVKDESGLDTPIDSANIAIGVHADFRKKGYAEYVTNLAKEWFETNPDLMSMNWRAVAENMPSIKLAEKNGFKKIEDQDGEVTLRLQKDKKVDTNYLINKGYAFTNNGFKEALDQKIAKLNKSINNAKTDDAKNSFKSEIKAYNIIKSQPEKYLDENGRMFYKGEHYNNLQWMLWDIIDDMENSIK